MVVVGGASEEDGGRHACTYETHERRELHAVRSVDLEQRA